MNNGQYKISYRALLKAKTLLEKSGYVVIASKGKETIFDLVALNEHEIRAIQIKSVPLNELPAFGAERAFIAKIKFPRNVQKELWVWEHRSGFHYFTIGNKS